MSLADQSQTWYPTSVQVTVVQARNLRIKGKNGTNDAYAIMQVAKDKFSTSVAEKCVAPVWKEEAAFDLPLFHQSNAERCTLYIIVMHRAHVGLDKHLGQAVVNLLDLHDSKSRKKTEWFKLVDKNGKEDKVRGEVLLDIQFMRNNMSASMFDLSMQDKPRSRISKLKDKVRGKKKDGFSDSASAIVPSTSQAFTDSEGEAEARSPEAKKKSKLKSLFGSKSNLQRNVSQSMSTLGALPEKNSSLSSSRSSGLNVDSPDVKRKFKFLGHKRTDSSDSKLSLGPFSLLGRSKQNANDPNNLCINGSHVYAEEAEPKSGSTLSLNSSDQGSVEDVRRHNSDVSVDSLKGLSVPSYQQETADRDRAQLEQRRALEEEERRQAEERRRAEAKRLHEEEEKEQKQQEQERRKLFLEDEAARRKLEEERKKKLKEEEEERKKKQKEEEEGRKKRQKEEEEEEKSRVVEERRRLQAQVEQERQEEEAKSAEDRKRQEEASMTDRLSTLFGIIKKKEDPHQQNSNTKEQVPKPAPHSVPRDPEVPRHTSNPFEEIPDPEVSPHSSNPFEDVSLSQDPPVRSVETTLDHQKPQLTPQAPSAMVFLNRTAKVSAVKPRLIETQTPETPDLHKQGLPLSPPSTESSLSSVPSESPVTFSSLHSSLAPPNARANSSESPRSDTENLTVVVGSSPTMAEKKRQAPLPPAHVSHGTRPDPASQMKLQSIGNPSGAFRSSPSKPVASGGFLVSIKESEDTGDGEVAGAKPGQRPSLPLPDYESLFPVKRHGVKGQTRWDHIIAEVNQKQRDYMPQLAAKEMSVDGPVEDGHSHVSAPLQVKTALRPSPQTTQPTESQPSSLKKGPAPPPPKPVAAASPRPALDIGTTQNQKATPTKTPVETTNVSSSTVNFRTSSRERPSMKPREDLRKVLKISANDVNAAKSVGLVDGPRPVSRDVSDARLANDLNGTPSNIPKEIPTAKPRQKIVNKDTERQADPQVTSTKLTSKEQEIQPKPRTASPDLTETSSDLIKHTQANLMRQKKPTPNIPSDTEKWQILEKVMKAKEKLVEPDPFPSSEVLSRDPWSFPEQNFRADDLFTGTTQKEILLKDQGIATDLENPFATDDSTDPFSSVDISDSEKPLEQSEADGVPSKDGLFQRGFSHGKKRASAALSTSEKKGPLEPKAEETTTTSESLGLDGLQSQVDSSRQNYSYGGETPQRSEQKAVDPFVSSSHSTVPSVLTAPEPCQAGVEDTAPQPGALSGGRPQLKAWVSPSDALLNSNGGGPALTPRRPHPVRPMSTGEIQSPNAIPAVRELKTLDSTTGKIKVSGAVDSGPYSQLTQEELITLVVKQQEDLSKKNGKIVELEEYIDNLLVRVIEEKPSLLLGLTSTKQAL